MPIFESTARITRRYLMNKTKDGICDVLFLILQEKDRLQSELDTIQSTTAIHLETKGKPMPDPNDTTARDAMFARMEMATGRPPAEAFVASLRAAENWQAQQNEKMTVITEALPIKAEVFQRLNEKKQIELVTGGSVLVNLGPVHDGAVLAACLRDQAKTTLSVVEDAVKPYSNVDCFGIAPHHRWLARDEARPYHVAKAVARAIDARPITEAQVDAARAVLPGVDPGAIHLALLEARRVQADGE